MRLYSPLSKPLLKLSSLCNTFGDAPLVGALTFNTWRLGDFKYILGDFKYTVEVPGARLQV